MKIKAGDLRQVVTLIKPVTTTGEHNRRKTEYVDAATVPAAKSDVSGREFFQAHAVNAEDIVTFTIRWRDDIDTTWRVRHGGATYGVLEVNHLGYMRDYLRLKCRSVAGGGV
jgi:SPP1 family predicted phage head-tail adaptor